MSDETETPNPEVQDPPPTPTNVNGEVIYDPLVNQAVVGVPYVAPQGPTGSIDVEVTDLSVVATLTGGNPDEYYRIVWGDGTPSEEFVADSSGGGTASHTYAAAGTYTTKVTDSVGNPLATSEVVVTDPAVPEVESDEFDPADHTVTEVEDYVAANPDERARILDSERAGKNRTTLIEGLSSG